MDRFAKIALTAFALTAATATAALPALADPGHARQGQVAEKGDHDKKFPMPAAEFKQHIDARIQKTRARMEEHIAKKQLPEDKAKEARARFDAAVAQVNAKVTEVCADGTVTKDEAKAVHEVAKAMHPHKKHEKSGAPAKK